MKMKKWICMFFVAVMMVGLLTGCGSTEKQAAPSSPATGTSESAGSVGTIKYASMWTESEPQAVWLAGVFADFEAETGIQVDVSWVGRDVLTQMMTQLGSDHCPDIVEQDVCELSGALLKEEEQLIMPLDDLLMGPGPEGQDKFISIFNEDIMDMYKFNGSNYFLPYNFITSGFFYNKDLFAQVGVNVPSTWTEFIDVAEKFDAAGIPLCAQDNDSMYNLYWLYWAIERVMGPGKLLDACTDVTGKLWKDDPGYLMAAEIIYQAATSNVFEPSYASSLWPASQNDLALGNEGAILCGSWIPVELSGMAGDDFKWGFFPFPAVEGGYETGTTQLEGYVIGASIPTNATNPELAKQLLTFMSKKEYAQKFADEAQCMHCRTDVTLPAILADIQPYLNVATVWHPTYDNIAAKASQYAVDVLYPLDDQLLHGEITAEQFINTISEATASFYAR